MARQSAAPARSSTSFLLTAVVAMLPACGDAAPTGAIAASGSVDGTTALGTAGARATTAGSTTGSRFTGATGPASTTSGARETANTGAIFDVSVRPDFFRPFEPVIPETCEGASRGETSVGCEFYTVDLNTNLDDIQFAVAVSNVQLDQSAEVVIERRVGGLWQVMAGPQAIPALSLVEFPFLDFHTEDSGFAEGGAYRISSDVPVIAYQFNPIDGATSFMSDASMLYPVASWDSLNSVVGWSRFAFVTVAAATDGTVIEVTPSTEIAPGDGVPLIPALAPTQFTLNAGDAITFTPADNSIALTGTRITTDPQTPVAVFSGNECASIPADVCCCDHLEEQLSGVQLWGQNFVAAHMPVRDIAVPEATLWQVYASQDNTVVNFDANVGVTGLDNPSITLDRGQVYEAYVSAPAGGQADFTVEADKPISVVGYMISSQNLTPGLNQGDPAMVQFPAVEQFIPRYVILVPGTWVNDQLMLTRATGATVELDGVAVSDAAFVPVADGSWEVARIDISDGVHVLDGGLSPFGVVVIGWDEHDSYAYIGGTGTGKINPSPEG